MSHPNPEGQPESIAIIGMAGRFPGASDVVAYWENLRNGVESISFFTDDELLAAGVDAALLTHPNYVKAAAQLEGVELFDAAFFGCTPREAEITDPQQRLFLECAWQALESAGYDAERYAGPIGVYAGMSMSTYWMSLYAHTSPARTASRFQIGLLNDKDHLATRVSYKLNLQGPSLNVQTACSTSLVAVHTACQSLLYGECDMALAGGVSVTFPPAFGYLYEEGGINSPDGHCRAFDAKAQGTVGGNGVGVVVLKRLTDALADGDTVLAIIKGSAINNDGSMKVGYTAPSVAGQTKVIAEALSVAGVTPESISYVEAHGTGTALGDPIEIEALTQAFRPWTGKKTFCAIGSVKTNIGHLDAAAGIAGLIKVVQALRHKQLPPSLHFEQANPKINFADSPFYVNTLRQAWARQDTPRRAGVSSFGIGGTNAHLIVEEAEAAAPSGPSRPWQLLTLSARTATALEAATAHLADYLARNRDLPAADVAYTLGLGRRAFGQRRILVCRDLDEAIAAFGTPPGKQVFTGTARAYGRPVVFMFAGQGAQYVGMASEIYEHEAVFREQVDDCARRLVPHLGFDLRDLIYPRGADAAKAARKLNETVAAQPALFVIEYALAKLWMAWGVKPRALIGHSLGEYVAACLAGVFSLDDGLALVAARARLMQQLSAGGMLAAQLPEADLKRLLNPLLALAAVNGPSRCVVSGPLSALDEFERALTRQAVACRRLHTSHAFHSEMMEPILGAFTEQVKRVELHPPQIAYLSNLTGTWITAAQATDAAYWARHLRETVRFGDGLAELMKVPDSILLEVGPGQTLSALAKQQKTADHLILSSLAPAQGKDSGDACLLRTLGRLWVAGLEVDWQSLYAGQRRRRLSLPTYPFERRRYRIEPAPDGAAQTDPVPAGDDRPSQPRPAVEAVAEAGTGSGREVEAQSAGDAAPPAGRPGALAGGALATSSNGRLEAVRGGVDDSTEPPDEAGLERIIARQLDVMSQQLFVLYGSDAGGRTAGSLPVGLDAETAEGE